MSSEKSKTYDAGATTSPVPNEFIDSSCIAHIRAHDKYAEELGYGFDWMRIGDTTYNSETEIYEDMVGNLYCKTTKNSVTTYALETDVNQYYIKKKHHFEKNADMYKCLENEYNLASGAKVFIKKQKKLERYYVPILSLQQSKPFNPIFPQPKLHQNDRVVNHPFDKVYKAHMKLNIEIIIPPLKLYWEFPDGYKEAKGNPKDEPILITGTLPNTKGVHNVDICVQCNKAITKTIDIKLIAEYPKGKKKLAGAFRIWKNIEKHPKIVLIDVISNISGKEKQYEKKILKNRFIPLIQKYLQPSLVCPQIGVESLDMTSSWWHKDLSGFISSDGNHNLCIQNDHPNKKKSLGKIYKRLDDAFKDKFNEKYNEYIKVFYINETAVCYLYNKEKSKGVGPGHSKAVYEYKPFYAAAQVGSNLILFTKESDFDDTVSAHEIYHALGLVHSFSNYENAPAQPGESFSGNGKYTYDSFNTDNIMDYLTGSKPARSLFSTWWWQWRVVNP